MSFLDWKIFRKKLNSNDSSIQYLLNLVQMKTKLLLNLLLLACINVMQAAELISIQDFDVKPGNSAAVNKVNLQKAIDWASAQGAAL